MAWRSGGTAAYQLAVVVRIAELLGLKPGTPREMAEGFQLKKVAVREEGVRV